MTKEPIEILMIVTRDAQNNILSCIGHALPNNLQEALATARILLKEKKGAVCVEIHHYEGTMSSYTGKPLAVLTLDDISDDEKADQGNFQD